MKITKLGHCCILIEEQGVRIITDPGAWTAKESSGQNADAILITHEHQDHFHVDSIKDLLSVNPNAVVITNETVGKLLDAEGVKYILVQHGQSTEVKGVKIEGFGEKHAIVYESYGQTENTGFMIGEKFYFPGDSFFNPNKYIEALALPVAGPWMTIANAIDYAKAIHPKKCFPVHDGFLSIRGFLYFCVTTFLEPYGIEFVDTDKNNSFEI